MNEVAGGHNVRIDRTNCDVRHKRVCILASALYNIFCRSAATNFRRVLGLEWSIATDLQRIRNALRME